MTENTHIEKLVLGYIIRHSILGFAMADMARLHGGCFKDPYCRTLWELLTKHRHELHELNDAVLSTLHPSKEIQILITSLTKESGGNATSQQAFMKAVHHLRRTYLHEEVGGLLDDMRRNMDVNNLDEQLSQFKAKLEHLNQVEVPEKSVQEIFQELNQDFVKAKTKGYNGYPSRFLVLNARAGSYKPGKITLHAGRPKQGKSIFALNEALHMAMHFDSQKLPHFVDIISLEMTAKECWAKLTCDAAHLDFFTLDEGRADDDTREAFNEASKQVRKLPIRVHDGYSNYHRILGLFRSLYHEANSRFVVLDFLTAIEGDGIRGENRQAEVSRHCMGLANIFKPTEAHGFIVAQLNRSSEYSDDQEPDAHNLRDTGVAEQAAYRVQILYRKDKQEQWTDNAPTILKVAINRCGGTGKINLVHKKTQGHFEPEAFQ